MLPTILPSIRQRLMETPFEHIDEAWRDVLAMYGGMGNRHAEAVLGRADRYCVLTALLHRPDAAHPWLYARCREMERC